MTRNLPVLTDADALGLAQYLAAVYGTPIFRFTSVVLDGHMTDLFWPQMLSRQISDRVTIVQRPPPIATAIVADCYVESIAHDVTASDDGVFWRTTFGLSSADTLAGGASGCWTARR